MRRIEIFRTLFPHSNQNFTVSCYFLFLRSEIKKCRNAFVSSISAKYPGRDLNPHDRNGQRILSPSCLPFHHPGGIFKWGKFIINYY